MKSSRRRRRRHGFTLMEVLLVLAILVILGSLVGVSIFTMQRNANVRAAKAQISMLEDAIKAYQIDVGRLPTSLESLVAAPADIPNPTKWQGPYLEKLELPKDPWGIDFEYVSNPNTPTGFEIRSAGPDMQPGSQDDVTL